MSTVFRTNYPADSCEFLDVNDALTLICGTYLLDEENQVKRGELFNFRVYNDDQPRIEAREPPIPTGAVLDLHWIPRAASMPVPILALAAHDGIDLFSLNPASAHLEHRSHCTPNSARMCLQLCWSPLASSGSAATGLLLTSLSDGHVATLTVTESALRLDGLWSGHDFEVWSCAFDACNPALCYTGADDARLCCWDLRVPCAGSGDTDELSEAQVEWLKGRAPVRSPAWSNARSHGAGITAIAPHPTRPHILATGSYDEYLRLFDTRRPTTPLLEAPMQGGVWRLRWADALMVAAGFARAFPGGEEADALLCALTRGSVRAVALDGAQLLADGGDGTAAAQPWELFACVGVHESMVYGIDWWAPPPSTSPQPATARPLVASASFYDRMLRVWHPGN